VGRREWFEGRVIRGQISAIRKQRRRGEKWEVRVGRKSRTKNNAPLEPRGKETERTRRLAGGGIGAKKSLHRGLRARGGHREERTKR
jgi:hypothetical protein